MRSTANISEGNSSLRATNVELFSREISADSQDTKIYSRDADNLYPLRIEKIINNSPTARRCANLMAKYIAGNGNSENYSVNKKGKFINDIIRAAASSIAKQYGVYFRLYYTLDVEMSTPEEPFFKIGGIEVLDYVIMAKSKEDGNDFPGKYYVLKQDENNKFSGVDDDNVWLYPYSGNQKVIKQQMKHDCSLKNIKNPSLQQMLQNYRGQVFYMNLTPEYIYALPLADSVYNDCDTEYRISNYNNVQTRSGFLGKTVVVKYEDDAEESSEFDDELKDFLGSENSASVFVVDVPQNVDTDLDKAFVVKQLKPQFDDKLFESTIKSIRQNIMGAFNNIPEALVFAGSGSLFGTSADTYSEMKKFYWEQNEYERGMLEQTLRMFGYDVNIIPIVKETNTSDGM